MPAVFGGQRLEPEAHTLFFVLAVLGIVPLAVSLSHATDSVAAKTGGLGEMPQIRQFCLKSDTLLDRVQEQSRLSQANVGYKRCV